MIQFLRNFTPKMSSNTQTFFLKVKFRVDFSRWGSTVKFVGGVAFVVGVQFIFLGRGPDPLPNYSSLI